MKLETQWVVGFVDGEGCFHIGISQNKKTKCGYQVLPEFVITQHRRSIQVLYALKTFFKSGTVRHSRGKDSDIMCLRIRNRTDLIEQVIPFFEKHSLKTTKQIDFLKFRKVVLFYMERKDHLNPEGIAKIRDYLGKEKNNSANEILKLQSTEVQSTEI